MGHRRLNVADTAGGVASFLCAVHCAAVGLAATLLPMVGAAWLHDERLDWGFLGTAVLIGAWAAARGWKLHRSWLPGALFASGLVLVAGSRLVTHADLGVAEDVGYAVSLIGGLVLVSFHVLNGRLVARHKCSCNACTGDKLA